MLSRIVRRCAGCVCCGRLGREFFLRYGADPSRIFISPYEPDYRLIQEVTPQRIEQVRQRYGLDPARRRLVYSGRLSTEKRVDLLIFNNPFAFAELTAPAYGSIVIVEFKRPERDDYTDEENPITQVYGYVRDIKAGKVKDRQGKTITLPALSACAVECEHR